MEEIFDIVDSDDKVVGKRKRSEVHGNPNLIHRSIAIIIFSRDRRIFLQQRSLMKDTDPMKWTISVSGHVGQGDTYEKAAERELKEELGINISLTQIAKYLVRSPQETEMTALYTAVSDGPFSLSVEEIMDGRFFSSEELSREVKAGKIDLSYSGRIALEKIGWLK
ncbi:MAG: NUDIX hydrolase [Candidatus Gottesmanbacteria bacterium GW2011_GWA2_43_14]|uniref:NUDIX hydrolase n=1 Tax=Candidatus Gottesmanbacteria bacterium GW2011_GWA2_43_14 TaxID=1618443 RepID=A0A0G1DKB9_9BACT|nr:MAG: NUDIX hydrolase [Candidatus Gottesmanbacteria bacterium GW2011_GWA2_43_14]